MPKIKQVLCVALLLLAGLSFGVVISELIASKYVKKAKLDEKLSYMKNKFGHYHQRISCDDIELGWGYEPNTKDRVITSDFDVVYSINSNRMRDREVPLQKREKGFRIVALGESTVFGEGVNYGERFTEIIEQALNNIEVLNMGRQGFGMDQSFLQLQRGGFKFRPDLVVLFVIEDYLQRCKDVMRNGIFKPRFVFNDDKNGLILQDLNFIKANFSSMGIETSNNPEEKTAGVEKTPFFLRKSKLLVLINYFIVKKKTDEQLLERSGGLEEKDRAYWKNTSKQLSAEEESKGKYGKEDFKRLFFFFLKNYKEACDEHKVNFLVVNIDYGKIPYIADFCRNLDIPYLDLSIILTRASKIRSLKFEIDPHYNEFAHRVIGEYVADYLKDRYFLQKNKNFSLSFLGKF